MTLERHAVRGKRTSKASAKPSPQKKMNEKLQWLIASLGHAVIAMLVAAVAFELPWRIALLIGIGVYLGMWYIAPMRFYRRMIASMIGLFGTLLTLSSMSGELQSSWAKLSLQLTSSPVSHLCWTAIILTLLVMDFLSRQEKTNVAGDTATRGESGGNLGPSTGKLRFLLNRKIVIALLIISAVAVFLAGPI